MKRKVLLLVGVFAVILCGIGYAGWQHIPNSNTTKWTDAPTPATCWIRDYRLNVVWSAQQLFIYQDTPRYFNHAAAADTVDQAYTGFWTKDSNGIYWPRTDLSEAWAKDSTYANLIWMDVEWYLGTNGVLWTK